MSTFGLKQRHNFVHISRKHSNYNTWCVLYIRPTCGPTYYVPECMYQSPTLIDDAKILITKTVMNKMGPLTLKQQTFLSNVSKIHGHLKITGWVYWRIARRRNTMQQVNFNVKLAIFHGWDSFDINQCNPHHVDVE